MIFFDIDRTLFDYDTASRAGLKDFYHRYSADLKMEFDLFLASWEKLFSHHWPDFVSGRISREEHLILRMRDLCPAHSQLNIAELKRRNSLYQEAFKAHWKLFPDVLPVLSQIDQRVGIISNGDEQMQISKLQHLGIAQYFEPIIISGAYGVAKPDPRLFRIALDKAGVDAGESLHVGDSLTDDVRAASQIGMQAIWLNRSGRSMRPSVPTRTITSLNELFELSNRCQSKGKV